MRVGQWKKGKNAFSYFSITSHFSFLLFHTAKGMNKDGAGPSSWTKRKKKQGRRERWKIKAFPKTSMMLSAHSCFSALHYSIFQRA